MGNSLGLRHALVKTFVTFTAKENPSKSMTAAEHTVDSSLLIFLRLLALGCGLCGNLLLLRRKLRLLPGLGASRILLPGLQHECRSNKGEQKRQSASRYDGCGEMATSAMQDRQTERQSTHLQRQYSAEERNDDRVSSRKQPEGLNLVFTCVLTLDWSRDGPRRR